MTHLFDRKQQQLQINRIKKNINIEQLDAVLGLSNGARLSCFYLTLAKLPFLLFVVVALNTCDRRRGRTILWNEISCFICRLYIDSYRERYM